MNVLFVSTSVTPELSVHGAVTVYTNTQLLLIVLKLIISGEILL